MAWETFCREQAENCKAIQMGLKTPEQVFVPVQLDPLSKLLWTLAECFWRFLAGFTNGLAAGYISHLILDAATPRSIPLLAAGF